MSKQRSFDPIQQQKKQLRAKIRQIRNGITGEPAALASQALANRLAQLPAYQAANKVACFISFDGEINTQPIIQMLLCDKQRCYLPKLKPRWPALPNRLWFMPYHASSQLANNKLGIPEVDLTVNHAIAVSKLDMILLPLVAFDEQGNRLGMGGGYYDATLAHLQHLPIGQRPYCVGVAYQQQMLDSIPKQNWDFPLDGVLTQTRFFAFNEVLL